MAIPLQAPTVEVQREEYGAVEVESVLTVGPSSRRMTVECVAFNLVGVSSDTFAMEVSGTYWRIRLSFVLFQGVITGSVLLNLLVYSHMDDDQTKSNVWFMKLCCHGQLILL